MKKSLSSLAMLAAAAGLALGVAQGAKAANPDAWFYNTQKVETRRADRSGGWYVRFNAGLSFNTNLGGSVAPFESNQMFGVVTPFTAAIVVGCQFPRSMAASTAQRSWSYNASQNYPALVKSCLFFGNATGVQGTMNINL